MSIWRRNIRSIKLNTNILKSHAGEKSQFAAVWCSKIFPTLISHAAIRRIKLMTLGLQVLASSICCSVCVYLHTLGFVMWELYMLSRREGERVSGITLEYSTHYPNPNTNPNP